MTIETPKQSFDKNDGLKTELSQLAEAINIKEKTESFWKIDALLNKVNSLNENQKNLALQHALKDSDIMVGNTLTKLWTIAELFDKALEQDNQTWKLKLKEWVQLEEHEKTLVEPFLNEKESPLAYLIQKSSNFAKIQAERWYGERGETLIGIGVDKILWNQTKRALSGLQSWIESDLEASGDTIDITKLNVATILGMKYISQALKEKIEAEWSAKVKKLWEDDAYEYSNPYTNNFALKKKNDSSDIVDSKGNDQWNHKEWANKAVALTEGIEEDAKLAKKKEKLIKWFWLKVKEGDANFYTRDWYMWLYTFGDDGFLYYSWNDFWSLQFLWGKETNWKEIKTSELPSPIFIKKAIIHSLNLSEISDNRYEKDWYNGQYAFDDEGVLYYSWLDFGNLKFLWLRKTDEKVKRDFSTPTSLWGSLSNRTKKIVKKEFFPAKERENVTSIPEEINDIEV